MPSLAGTLDLTFGSGGHVTTDFGAPQPSSDAVGGSKCIAVQPDGKIVVAGSKSNSGSYHFALARYKVDGSLDNTFGGDGLVTLDFGSSTASVASSLAVQADGKIVVVGSSYFGVNYDVAIVAVARLECDGSPDESFGNGGKMTFDFSSSFCEASAVAVQADGKIVVAGDRFNADFSFIRFAVARLNQNGSLDDNGPNDSTPGEGFGSGGKKIIDSANSSHVTSMALQADGKVVLAGWSDQGGTAGTDFAVARLNSDGSLDDNGPSDSTPGEGFGSGGKKTIDFDSMNDHAFNVAVQANGKIVVAGFSSKLVFPDADYAFSVARLDSDGSLDTTFNGSGKANMEIPLRFGIGYEGTGMAVQPDGKITVAGNTEPNSSGFQLTVFRLDSDGSPDEGFGTSGATTTDFASEPGGVALQPDGKIIVAGVGNQGPAKGNDFVLARFHGVTDTDNDGIADSVDTLPTYSNRFDDGTTTGTIVTRGDQVLTIVDAPNAADGIQITAGFEGGSLPATIAVPGGTIVNGASFSGATLCLSAGDQVIVTHGSVILDVRAGPIDVTFRADNGQQATARLPTGSGLTFKPETGAFIAAATNPATIIVVLDGAELRIAPGATVLPVQVKVLPRVINLASQRIVPVAIYTTAGFDAALVDSSTVLFAGARAVSSALEDVDNDGDLDLVLHFRLQDTNLRALYEQKLMEDVDADGVLDSTRQSAQVALTGETVGGDQLGGFDEVNLFLSGLRLRELLDQLFAAG